MLSLLVPIAALLISDALLLVGHGLLLTLLPIVGSSIGFTSTQIALTGSAYFLGFVSGCIATPHLLKRVGHIRVFAVLATLYSAVILIFPWVPEFFSWLLLRFLIGASVSGIYMVIESWLNERATGETRGTVLSIYTMLNFIMIMIGQQLFNVAPSESYQLFGLAAIFISIAIIPVCLSLSLAPAPVTEVKINLPKVWQNSHVGLIGASVSGLVTGGFWSLAPVYASASGFDSFQLSLFLSATVLGGACFQLPLGRLSDSFDRRIILIYSALAGALFSIIFVFASSVVGFAGWPAAVLAFLWGGMTMTLYAICLAHANDNASPSDFVQIGSSMLFILGISSAIGAPIASFMMTLIGPSGLYVYMTICLMAFTIVVSIRRRTHILPDAPETNESFRSVTDMATPAVYEMDPRNDESGLDDTFSEPRQH